MADKESVIDDWLQIIKGSADNARISGGIGVARMENGQPSVVTLKPTGKVREGRQVFKATLQYRDGVVDGGEVISDIPLDPKQLQDIQERNEKAVEQYQSLI